MEDFKAIQKKWADKWAQEKVFESNPNNDKKFFLTFPYPYINLYPHIGHFYSIMRVEALARYKRMLGFNTLFPQAWHCTGSPMVNAALRIKEGEKKQIETLKKMGFLDTDIPKFKDPKHWIKVFSKGWQEDLTNAGLSIDWRRNFITTSLNPHYNKFIEWQFRTLQSQKRVRKGKKPVVWCPKCNQAIGDHARVEGEGETPQEYTIIKLKIGDEFIGCASLRPETIFGQTNVWIDAETEYAKIKVNDKENWIVSQPCADKLALQDMKIEKTGSIKGRDLIGKYCHAPGVDRDVIILPSNFCDPNIGTGIVTSVPSDAPDDYIGLRDLQQNKEECEKYGLNWQEIKAIKTIPIIRTKEFGEQAAVKIVEDLKIKDQNDREKLEKARKAVYKSGFHTGKMSENSGKYNGMPVEEAKEAMKKWLLETNNAALMYDPTGKVVCRCLTPAVVKIVSNQWFLAYGDEDWKKLAHKCLDNMKLYPDKTRSQFNYVIDWLNDWACTHQSETELGTALPWDDQWVIESLSDSTIYMAYYTIAHKIKDISIENIDDKFFDYVFLGKGNKSNVNVDAKLLDELSAEFNYWYPMDLRSTGKDLIQNHMTFSIFIHTAIFPEKHWPRSFGLNGWVTVDGTKMSKSLGNVIPVRTMIEQFSVDASRITILYGGEGIDDANWDSELARSMKGKIELIHDYCIENYNKGTNEKRAIDDWMEAQLNKIIKETTEAMEQSLFRSALQSAYFELQRALRWYGRRAIEPNNALMNKIIETQLLLLTPFAPFICEETWEVIGKKGFITNASWPKYDEKINLDIILAENIIKDTIDDINSVLKLTKITKPSKIQLFASEPWKYKLYKILKKEIKETRDFKVLIGKVMADSEVKKYGKEATKIIQRIVKSGKGLNDVLSHELEYKSLVESKDFLEREFKSTIIIKKAEDSEQAKAKQALPGKPAILVEG